MRTDSPNRRRDQRLRALLALAAATPLATGLLRPTASWSVDLATSLAVLAFVVLALRELEGERKRRAVELDEMQEALRLDVLTGIGNPFGFRQRMAALRPGSWLMVCDVDGLKPINDRQGHRVGDEVLQRAAAVLSASSAGTGGDVFRIGGDEFALVLGGDESAARRIAERIAEAMINEPEGARLSIGLARVASRESAWVAFDRADDALYRAKRAGGARYAVGSETDLLRPTERLWSAVRGRRLLVRVSEAVRRSG